MKFVIPIALALVVAGFVRLGMSSSDEKSVEKSVETPILEQLRGVWAVESADSQIIAWSVTGDALAQEARNGAVFARRLEVRSPTELVLIHPDGSEESYVFSLDGKRLFLRKDQVTITLFHSSNQTAREIVN